MKIGRWGLSFKAGGPKTGALLKKGVTNGKLRKLYTRAFTTYSYADTGRLYRCWAFNARVGKRFLFRVTASRWTVNT